MSGPIFFLLRSSVESLIVSGFFSSCLSVFSIIGSGSFGTGYSPRHLVVPSHWITYRSIRVTFSSPILPQLIRNLRLILMTHRKVAAPMHSRTSYLATTLTDTLFISIPCTNIPRSRFMPQRNTMRLFLHLLIRLKTGTNSSTQNL